MEEGREKEGKKWRGKESVGMGRKNSRKGREEKVMEGKGRENMNQEKGGDMKGE